MLLAGLIGNARAADPGDLDTDFGAGGLTYTDIDGASGDQAYSVAIQADDKIVVAGSSDYDFAVVRYNISGTLDTSFGAGGIVTASIGISNDVAYAVAIQADGRIVVAGSANDTFVLRVRGATTLYLPLLLQSTP